MSAEQTIYNVARAGTVNNPGLPDPLASLLVAQSKHETGNYASKFFQNYNNAFGYSYNSGSPYQSGHGTTADNLQYIAAYNSVADSTREVVDWIYRRRGEGNFPIDLNTIRTPQQYAELLRKSGYYTDTLTNYSSGLQRWWAPITLQQTAAGAGTIIFVGVALWMLRKYF